MRAQWVEVLHRITTPVFSSFSKESLNKDLPFMKGREEKQSYALLECIGRSFAGIGPFLNCHVVGEEKKLQDKLIHQMQLALDIGTRPNSPDRFNFTVGGQPIVDASFLALGLLRSYEKVWLPLDGQIKKRVIQGLKDTRSRKPGFNNWLLFSALIEAFLFKVGEKDWDAMRIDYAIRQHEQWYLGDGVYGDGPQFHFDYYNSFVIQPYILEIMEVFNQSGNNPWAKQNDAFYERAKRFAVIQERHINNDGSYPVIGRSIAYRNGAFHHLSYMAWKNLLPKELTKAQVRCGMTAVLTKLYSGQQNFDDKGWLLPGLNGNQIDIAENYINSGSLYLTLCGFLHLGLPADDGFWKSPDEEWTSKKVWSGKTIAIDHCM